MENECAPVGTYRIFIHPGHPDIAAFSMSPRRLDNNDKRRNDVTDEETIFSCCDPLVKKKKLECTVITSFA